MVNNFNDGSCCLSSVVHPFTIPPVSDYNAIDTFHPPFVLPFYSLFDGSLFSFSSAQLSSTRLIWAQFSWDLSSAVSVRCSLIIDTESEQKKIKRKNHLLKSVVKRNKWTQKMIQFLLPIKISGYSFF